jgi:hypothetical protein
MEPLFEVDITDWMLTTSYRLYEIINMSNIAQEVEIYT